MPRIYRRPVGARKYKDFSDEQLASAVKAVKDDGLSLRKAAEQYGISRCALTAAVKGKPNKVGRPCILSPLEENQLVECVTLAGKWGFPLTSFDIRLIVKGFLDRSGRTEKRLKNNMPGIDFVESFMKRHDKELSNRLCQNIKRNRAAVNEKILNNYFDELTISLEGVEPGMIVNYDETNIADDPGRKKVIVRRGTRHPERIVDSSKSSTSVMFSGSADGKLLPPYITYKALNLYDSWTENGPKGAVYNRSKSGWFTLEIFEDWFRKIAIPYFKKFDKDAVKVIIGDNLASHISLDIINECKINNIKFVLLPPNSTHFTQPLDVAFFRPLKVKWRQTLSDWKEKNRGTIPKDRFPRLLKKCIEDMGEENIAKNLISGFRGSGISPLDREQVLKRLPSGPKEKDGETLNDSGNTWAASLQSFLAKSRVEETTQPAKERKKKLNVPPGVGVQPDDMEEDNSIDDPAESQPSISKQAQEKTRVSKRGKKDSSDSSDNDEVFSLQDSDAELVLSDFTDDNFEEPEPMNVYKKATRTTVNMEEITGKPDIFVIVELLFDEGTKKEAVKQFYAKVITTSPGTNEVSVSFLRKSTKAVGNVFVFPYNADEMDVNISQIVKVVQPLDVKRGHHTFLYELN